MAIKISNHGDRAHTFGSGGAQYGTNSAPIALSTTKTKLLAAYGTVTAATTGALKTTWNKMKVATTAQNGDVSLFGVENQLQITIGTTASSFMFGSWNYFEEAAAAAATFSSGYYGAGFFQVETSSNLTVGASAFLCGVMVESKISSSSTLTGTVAAIYIQESVAGTYANWPIGILINDCTLAMKFDTSCAAATGTCTTASGYVKIDIGGSTRYLQAYTGNGA